MELPTATEELESGTTAADHVGHNHGPGEHCGGHGAANGHHESGGSDSDGDDSAPELEEGGADDALQTAHSEMAKAAGLPEDIVSKSKQVIEIHCFIWELFLDATGNES